MIAAIALALTTGIVFGTLIPTGLLGAAFVAQNRFRAAISRYVAIVGLLVTTMLASLSFTSVQVALGLVQA